MMLEEAAAKRWGVPVSDVEAKNHEVVQKSTGKTLGYGDLAADAAKLDVPATDSLRLKRSFQFRYIGKEGTNIVDAFDITTGRATYGQDIRLPGRSTPLSRDRRSWEARCLATTPPRRRNPRASLRSSRCRAVLSDGFPAVGRHRRHRRQHLGRDAGPQGAEDNVGRRSARQLTIPQPTARRSRRQPDSPARSCAAKATLPRLSPARTRRSRRSTTFLTTRPRRWSRRRRLARLPTARRKSGQACKARRPRMIWSPSTWGFRARTSPST